MERSGTKVERRVMRLFDERGFMKREEFLAEFDEEYFPERLGKVVHIDTHDPPFKRCDLRKMAQEGIIVLDEKSWTYRLTLGATDAKTHNVQGQGDEQA